MGPQILRSIRHDYPEPATYRPFLFLAPLSHRPSGRVSLRGLLSPIQPDPALLSEYALIQEYSAYIVTLAPPSLFFSSEFAQLCPGPSPSLYHCLLFSQILGKGRRIHPFPLQGSHRLI